MYSMSKAFGRTWKPHPAAAIAFSLMLGACSVFSVHHIDVRQGNALEPKAIDQLQVGMTYAQVRYLLGNPMLDDDYHADRWDYVYYYDPGKGAVRERQLIVFFDDGQVVKIKGPREIATGKA